MKTPNQKIAFITFLTTFIFGCASQTTEPTVVETTPVKVAAITENTPMAKELPTDKSTVYFKFDSSILSSIAKNKISTHIRFLKDNPEFSITLEGHTDSRGDEQYNTTLGSQRAEVIKDLLIAQNISADKIELVSYGEKKPAMQGENENAWRSNRRAMFVYNKTEG